MNYDLIKNAMADLEEDDLSDYVKSAISESEDNADNCVKALQEGMQLVGQRFEEGDYFVADLIYAGEIMTDVMEYIKPILSKGNDEQIGRLILCTVQNDLHDIGKNIVKAILEASGFEVIDLGIDVPAEKIVDTAKQEGIKIIALSGVLTLSLDSMKATVEAFSKAGMRDDVKIIIGGAPVSEEACKNCGADAWTKSPQKTAEICKGWL